jgi:DNA-binding transcriptional regulator YhcF (GntR family)
MHQSPFKMAIDFSPLQELRYLDYFHKEQRPGMEFYIEKHGSASATSQIEEQIKFAIMMGVFRNGDALPSIRDIEKQMGIHRTHINKAYLALRRSGLIVLMHGKGSVVSNAIDAPGAISTNCNKLCQQVISKTRQLRRLCQRKVDAQGSAMALLPAQGCHCEGFISCGGQQIRCEKKAAQEDIFSPRPDSESEPWRESA